MLTNGLVVDSAVLPQNAVQEHPVVVSADSLMASIHSDASQAQGTLLASGGSLLDSVQLAGGAPGLTFSGQEMFDSTALHEDGQDFAHPQPGYQQTTSDGGARSEGEEEGLQYHPIQLSGVEGEQPSNLVEGTSCFRLLC